MLELLRIRGLGVIEDAELELSPGLTVITGETGAGKTMVVTGLGLLLGGKSDPSRVRPGARAAVVEGSVLVPREHPALARALEAGAELDDGRLLLTRTVSGEGRSRAHIGGRAAPIGVLADIGEDLMTVHGQDDQRRLLRKARQRDALDRFAGEPVARLLAEFSAAYARVRDVRRELAELTARGRDRARESELLRLGLAEVERVAPQDGEDAALALEDARLAHADGLRTSAQAARVALQGSDDDAREVAGSDAVTRLVSARRCLDQVREHDPALAELADRVAELGYLLADVCADLTTYTEGVDVDPVRLAEVQQRRAVLTRLTRTHGQSVGDVLTWAEGAARRLLELDGSDERGELLRSEESELLGRLALLAVELSELRSAAARSFATAVSSELAALAMPHARVDVDLVQTDAADGLDVVLGGAHRRVAFGPAGIDEAALLLSPHPGAAPQPLHRGASGGELSRVMLAVEVVFAGADPVPTFVFDEVDAGVGGASAVEIGRRLALLARSAQVLVVTHLPQVAAFADRHLRVVKTDDGSVSRSGVVALDDEARLRELSRMLAGLEGSGTALAHAGELLRTARIGVAQSAAPEGSSDTPGAHRRAGRPGLALRG